MAFGGDQDLLSRLERAHATVDGAVHRTPCVRSRSIDDALGCKVFFKAENMQRTGSFKLRGAFHLLANLSDGERSRGVVAHSSGNHGQAVAYAAQMLGIEATVVMPRGAPKAKARAAEAYGARVVLCDDTLESRIEVSARLERDTGATLVHSYDDDRVVWGAATVVRELVQDAGALDAVLVPVGGGGLAAGTLLGLAAMGADTSVVGCEPAGADDAHRSLKAGQWIPFHEPATVADGLRTTLGRLPFEILRDAQMRVELVTDDHIVDAMELVAERLKMIVEPSGATPLAALWQIAHEFEGQRVGVVLSGGNLNVSELFAHLRGIRPLPEHMEAPAIQNS